MLTTWLLQSSGLWCKSDRQSTKGSLLICYSVSVAEMAMEDCLGLFQSIGLSEAKAKDTIKNAAVSGTLKSFILEVRWFG